MLVEHRLRPPVDPVPQRRPPVRHPRMQPPHHRQRRRMVEQRAEPLPSPTRSPGPPSAPSPRPSSTSDLLFKADLHGKPAFLYLLREHQSSNDPDMPFRLFVYLARIWERFRKDPKTTTARLPPIIPAVIAHAPDGWTAPRTLHAIVDPHPATIDGLAHLVPDFSYLVEDLSHLSNEELWDRVVDAFAKVVLWLLRDTRDPERFLRNLGHLDRLDALLDRISPTRAASPR